MKELLRVCLRVIHYAHSCHVVHDLAISCPEQVVACVQLARVAIHKLQLQACLWLLGRAQGQGSIPIGGRKHRLVAELVADLATEGPVHAWLVCPLLLRLKGQHARRGCQQLRGKHVVWQQTLRIVAVLDEHGVCLLLADTYAELLEGVPELGNVYQPRGRVLSHSLSTQLFTAKLPRQNHALVFIEASECSQGCTHERLQIIQCTVDNAAWVLDLRTAMPLVVFFLPLLLWDTSKCCIRSHIGTKAAVRNRRGPPAVGGPVRGLCALPWCKDCPFHIKLGNWRRRLVATFARGAGRPCGPVWLSLRRRDRVSWELKGNLLRNRLDVLWQSYPMVLQNSPPL
mmetsp:Transcript_16788/g.43903  ORF Transcript_16788/g.43903 Transcript_16788/m.43903 type:complete len:342 (+) Transcript_16788:605-1630(+)